ncbi:cell division protein MraZ [bacterium BMS3Abin03]|nr:cell division protein MraZ [bacterium BMS3Abin03]
MFRGQFKYSVDSKGRISIPAKLRRHVAPDANETFIMTKGTATCIDIYPLDQWQHIEEKLLKLNPFNPADAKFIRMISQFASEDTMDSQARILIPQPLIEYAKIEKEVLILGALKKIEVWNPKIYEEYINQTGESYEQIAAKVMTE